MPTTGSMAAPSVAARTLTPGLLLVLALLSVIAPFATDLYLPAFPEMSEDLGVSSSEVQLTLTAFLVGVAVGQLVFGPLSDRFGRVRPLLIGAILCVVASIAAAAAPDLGFLLIARVLQGIAGAAGMVIGRAIVSDIAVGAAAARAFSLMMVVGGVAPVVAPVIGSLIAPSLGWRGILYVVAAISLLMLIAVVIVVRETHKPLSVRERGEPRRNPVRELMQRAYIFNTLAFGFSFAVLMAYISASPFLFQQFLGMSTLEYGLQFGANALALVVVSAMSARLTSRFGTRRLLGVGLGIVLLAAVALLVVTALDGPAFLYVVVLFVGVAALGLVLGNATSQALAATPRAAGTGSAVLGALQFALGALVSPIVGIGAATSAWAVAIVIAVCASVAVVAYLVASPAPTRGADAAGLLNT